MVDISSHLYYSSPGVSKIPLVKLEQNEGNRRTKKAHGSKP